MQVTICDVGPRDGLQNEATTLAPAVRAELCDRLAAAGVPRVEAVSFVNPKRVPQMAGAEEVMAAIERRPGTIYAGLVLNERGYERAVAAGVDEVHYAFPGHRRVLRAATRTRRSRRAVETSGGDRAPRAKDDGVRVTVTLSVAFGCPFEGAVDPAHVLDIARAGRRDASPTRSSSPTRSASACRRRSRRSCAGVAGARRPGRLPLPQHAQHRLRQRGRRDRRRVRRARRVASAAPAAARSPRARPATSRPRTSSTSCTAWATRPASTSTR